jgi:hypothetical protein
MCRVPTIVHHDHHAAEIAELLAAPPLTLADLFGDPEVRSRIGFSISHATERPRRQKRSRPARHVVRSR